jgi:diaminohydroxyphosphoribosylaminopyrimidine deaminase/5-amino-6-(5-phosphoribosylamino)uracil reductase
MDDRDYMLQALALAQRGAGYTAPNPMVGAVVVQADRIVGQGYHQTVGGAHAEVNALEDARGHTRGATLYVTLEPCNHKGRTPPCTRAILEAGIVRVVIAMADPNPDVRGGGAALLKQHGLAVSVGVCEKRARRLNEVFIKYSHTRRPFVVLKCAATLDGRIATSRGDSKWVTGPEARAYVHYLRHCLDGIMIGIGTVHADNPSLTTRLPDGNGRNPQRIVLDTHLSIAGDAKLLRQQPDSDTIIVTAKCKNEADRAIFHRPGIELETVAVRDGLIDLDELMDRLGARGITSLLIEGGSRVIGSALRSGIVDKINFFYAPKILGGDDGKPISAGQGPTLMRDAIPVSELQIRRFGQDIMLEGYL